MKENLCRPSDLLDVLIRLDSPTTVCNNWEWTKTLTEDLHYEMNLSDYISLLQDIKLKSFVSLWTSVINKMHIVEIKSSLSPHVAMNVSDFVYCVNSKKNETREETYNKRCEEQIEKRFYLLTKK